MSDGNPLHDLVNPPMWFEEAACKDTPRSVFFVEGKNSWLMLQAKMICIGDKPSEQCPVRLQCLQFAMNDTWGVFGGTSPHERGRIKRAIRRGESVTEVLNKLDKATRNRAEFLQRREKKTLVAYSEEAQARENCLAAIYDYLEEHGPTSAPKLSEALGFDINIVTDTLKIARGRGIIGSKRNFGSVMDWCLLDH